MKILLVDDNKSVLNMTARLLKTLGYETEAYDSADQALQKCASDDSFDLLITDLNMPNTTGLELAQKIRKIKPSLPILYISGQDQYSNTLTIQAKERYIPKPFTRDELQHAIKQIMTP